MIRYVLTALALKAFSTSSASRRIYRFLGNLVGERKRIASGNLDSYIARGNLFVELCRRSNAVRDGYRLLELGTGWMHWYSLYLRLFFELRVTMLDIWDNRQFRALQAMFVRLENALYHDDTPPLIRRNLHLLLECSSFTEIYAKFGLEYVIEPHGALNQLRDQLFDCIFSFHVLEHVSARNVDNLIRDIYSMTKPGSYTIHQIGIDDHVAHHDRSASHKQYLRYSEHTWKALFENKVQYFNRLQMSDWMDAFSRNGFILEERIVKETDISGLKISSRFLGYTAQDLACTNLTLVYRKPG